MEDNHAKLQSEYAKLQSEHAKLQSEHAKLQNDYSENTIIQSMNEMKERYQRLLQTTVPNYKYKSLSEKYIVLIKKITGCCVLIDYIIKIFKQIDLIRPNDTIQMSRIEMQLLTIKDLLEDSLEDCINPK